MTRIYVHQRHLGAVRECSRGGQPDFGVLVVGEDNPQSDNPDLALYPHHPGVSGARLMKILGLTAANYLNLWRTNLCNPVWDESAAAHRAVTLMEQVSAPWNFIVLLGNKVARKWGFEGGFFEHRVTAAHTVLLIPHPSGVVRLWNDPRTTTMCRHVLTDLAPHVPWGEIDAE